MEQTKGLILLALCGIYYYITFLFQSKSSYVLDSGFSGIFVWTGKDCSLAFRKKVWKTVNVSIVKSRFDIWKRITQETMQTFSCSGQILHGIMLRNFTISCSPLTKLDETTEFLTTCHLSPELSALTYKC